MPSWVSQRHGLGWRSLLPGTRSQSFSSIPHEGNGQADFPYVGWLLRQSVSVALGLQKKLARFLHQKRGGMSYPVFARKLGISSSSLHRMELGQQNVTLKTLEHLLKRLNCTLDDVFGEGKE
jgi:DNA-binding Xre family transcriptional regulator